MTKPYRHSFRYTLPWKSEIVDNVAIIFPIVLRLWVQVRQNALWLPELELPLSPNLLTLQTKNSTLSFNRWVKSDIRHTKVIMHAAVKVDYASSHKGG